MPDRLRLRAQVSGRRVGDVVPLEVLREGETCSLEVELQPSQPLVRRRKLKRVE